jgi:hypothetical protein
MTELAEIARLLLEWNDDPAASYKLDRAIKFAYEFQSKARIVHCPVCGRRLDLDHLSPYTRGDGKEYHYIKGRYVRCVAAPRTEGQK